MSRCNVSFIKNYRVNFHCHSLVLKGVPARFLETYLSVVSFLDIKKWKQNLGRPLKFLHSPWIKGTCSFFSQISCYHRLHWLSWSVSCDKKQPHTFWKRSLRIGVKPDDVPVGQFFFWPRDSQKHRSVWWEWQPYLWRRGICGNAACYVSWHGRDVLWQKLVVWHGVVAVG